MSERVTGGTTAPDDRAELENERDFLLQSLDDLEAERAAGGIDDESYRELHDDYTARAAAAIRALRDGVDARPVAPKASGRTRVLWIAGIVAFGVIAGVVLALALGARQEGELASGNRPTDDTEITSEDRIARLEEQIADDPANAAARINLAVFLEQDGDYAGALAQYDAVLEREPEHASALANSGRVFYVSALQLEPGSDQAVALVTRSKERLDAAVAADPELAEARYYRAVLYTNERFGTDVAISDLQRYLVLAPDGPFAEDARTLLSDLGAEVPSGTTVTTAP